MNRRRRSRDWKRPGVAALAFALVGCAPLEDFDHVVAGRPPVDLKKTSSQAVVTTEEIEQLPVQSLDDVVNLGYRPKFFGQILAALCVVIFGGLQVRSLGMHLPGASSPPNAAIR